MTRKKKEPPNETVSEHVFAFSVSKDQGIAVIQVKGAVNSHSSMLLRNAINEAFDGKQKKVVVEIGEVNYMDSSALATLVEGVQLAEQHKGRFILAGAIHEKVIHLFEITRLDGLFENYPTLQEAKQAIR
jgi:anti-sigma B factor antagonist